MPITPADALDLQIAKGPPSAEGFAKLIAGLPGAYYAGLDEAYKRRNQDAFQNLDPNKPVDLQNLYKTMLIQGGVPQGAEVAKGLQEQSKEDLLFGIARKAFPDTSGQPPEIPGAPPSTAGAMNATSPSLSPPTARITVQPNSYSPGTIAGEPVAPSIRSLLPSALGEDARNKLGASIQVRLGLPPGTSQDDPLPPQQYAQAQQIAQQAAAVPGRVAQAPSTLAPVQDPAEAARRATLAAKRDRFYGLAAAVEALDPKRAATYRAVAEAADKELQPTEAQRNSLADRKPGETTAEYDARKAAMAKTAENVAAIGTDTLKSAAQGYQAAQTTKLGLDQIDDAIEGLGKAGWMGTGAGPRLQFAKAFNTVLNALPDSVVSQDKKNEIQFDPSKIAKLEDFNKQSLKLGFETAKTLGSREAMQIVQQATKSVPNFEQSPLGAKLVSSSLRQAAQRQEDLFRFLNRPENQGRVGAEIDFNDQNPPRKYSLRATALSGIPVQITGKTEYDYLPSGQGIQFIKNGKPWTKP